MHKKLLLLIIITLVSFLAGPAVARSSADSKPAQIRYPNFYLKIAEKKCPELMKILERWELIDLYAFSNSISSDRRKIIEKSDDVTLKLVLKIQGNLKDQFLYINARIISNEQVEVDIDINNIESLLRKAEKFALTKKFVEVYPEARGATASYPFLSFQGKNKTLECKHGAAYDFPDVKNSVRYGVDFHNIIYNIDMECTHASCVAVSPLFKEIPAFTLQVPLNCSLVSDLPAIVPEFEYVLEDDYFKFLQEAFSPKLFGVVYSGKDFKKQETNITLVFPFSWGQEQSTLVHYYFQNGRLKDRDIERDPSQLLVRINQRNKRRQQEAERGRASPDGRP